MTASFRDLLVAVSSAAGALTGLLFVAMSVTPRGQVAQGPQIIRQVRSAAAILAFTNALAVALFGLVPGTNVGIPALALGLIGVMFTAASVRSIRGSQATVRQQLQQVSLMLLLLGIFGTELVAGFIATVRPSSRTPLETIGYALAASILVGISRAWEFVGDIDTGLSASIATLLGRTRPWDRAEPGDDKATEPPAGNPPSGS